MFSIIPREANQRSTCSTDEFQKRTEEETSHVVVAHAKHWHELCRMLRGVALSMKMWFTESL